MKTKYWTKSEYQQGELRDPKMRCNLYGLHDYIESDWDVLDIGCNSGGFPILLSSTCRTATGFDVDPVAIDYGKDIIEKNNINNCQLYNFDYAEFLKQNNQTFDMVLSLAVHARICKSNSITESQYFGELLNLLNSDGVIIVESHFFHCPSFQTKTSWQNMKDLLATQCDELQDLPSTQARRYVAYKKQ
jgi:cyclopropane fatty-acyl-phospholipid synthase-like methyltransferase